MDDLGIEIVNTMRYKLLPLNIFTLSVILTLLSSDYSLCRDSPLFFPGSYQLNVKEICDNNVDDDGDMLIDIFDPDCQCGLNVSDESLVSNGGFENIDSCCFALIDQGDVCLQDWFLVTLSPDYLSPNCNPSELDLLDQLGISYDTSFVDVGLSNESDLTIRAESIGTCLTSTLVEYRQYRLTLDILMLSALDFLSGSEDVFYTIYGVQSCPDIDDIDVSQNFCKSSLVIQAEEILTINLSDFERNKWVKFTQDFSPDFEISSLVLFSQCGQIASVTGTPFIYLNNINIVPAEVSPISGNINIVGPACTYDQ